MSKFKTGDIVRTFDYSYAMRLWPNGELNKQTDSVKQGMDEHLEIIASGLNLPGKSWSGDSVINDTIVKRKTDGAIIFIKEKFLRLIPPPKRYKKVKVEVRPFRSISDPQVKLASAHTATPDNWPNWCGLVQTIEIEVEDD